jgi:hypothetical protein
VCSDPFSELGRGMARGYCQAHHIGEGPCVVISDPPDQPSDLGREHRLTGDDLGKWRQGTFMISRGNSIKDEPVAEPAGEAHPHSGARHCVGVLLSRYRIVEWPVQMTEWDIDGHPGNRQFQLVELGHTR